MAIPSTTMNKAIAVADDDTRRSRYPDGTNPLAPSAPPVFTTSKTSSTITATITNANGATSYNVRVDAGAAVSGLTVSGLTAETAYSFQVQGVNTYGVSAWSAAVSITTSAASAWVEGTEPTVEAVSGTFTAGGTATLTVGNLSTKRNGQLAFINFEGETVGQQSPSLDYEGTAPVNYLVESSSPYFGSRYVIQEANNVEMGAAGIELAQNYDEIYAESWAFIETPDFNSGGDEQVKLFRLVPNTAGISGNFQASNPMQAVFHLNTNLAVTQNPDPSTGGASWYGDVHLNEGWRRYVMYTKLGDANVPNGKRYIKVADTHTYTYSGGVHFASPSGTVAATEWDGEELITRDSSSDTGLGMYVLPYYHRSDQHTISRVARIFLNDSPERVVVGDASAWSACSHLKTFVLKQVSRSGNQIVVDVDTLGPLATGPVYLYVFNQDGLYNSNGYLWRAA